MDASAIDSDYDVDDDGETDIDGDEKSSVSRVLRFHDTLPDITLPSIIFARKGVDVVITRSRDGVALIG